MAQASPFSEVGVAASNDMWMGAMGMVFHLFKGSQCMDGHYIDDELMYWKGKVASVVRESDSVYRHWTALGTNPLAAHLRSYYTQLATMPKSIMHYDDMKKDSAAARRGLTLGANRIQNGLTNLSAWAAGVDSARTTIEGLKKDCALKLESTVMMKFYDLWFQSGYMYAARAALAKIDLSTLTTDGEVQVAAYAAIAQIKRIQTDVDARNALFVRVITDFITATSDDQINSKFEAIWTAGSEKVLETEESYFDISDSKSWAFLYFIYVTKILKVSEDNSLPHGSFAEDSKLYYDLIFNVITVANKNALQNFHNKLTKALKARHMIAGGEVDLSGGDSAARNPEVHVFDPQITANMVRWNQLIREAKTVISNPEIQRMIEEYMRSIEQWWSDEIIAKQELDLVVEWIESASSGMETSAPPTIRMLASSQTGEAQNSMFGPVAARHVANITDLVNKARTNGLETSILEHATAMFGRYSRYMTRLNNVSSQDEKVAVSIKYMYAALLVFGANGFIVSTEQLDRLKSQRSIVDGALSSLALQSDVGLTTQFLFSFQCVTPFSLLGDGRQVQQAGAVNFATIEDTSAGGPDFEQALGKLDDYFFGNALLNVQLVRDMLVKYHDGKRALWSPMHLLFEDLKKKMFVSITETSVGFKILKARNEILFASAEFAKRIRARILDTHMGYGTGRSVIRSIMTSVQDNAFANEWKTFIIKSLLHIIANESGYDPKKLPLDIFNYGVQAAMMHARYFDDSRFVVPVVTDAAAARAAGGPPPSTYTPDNFPFHFVDFNQFGYSSKNRYSEDIARGLKLVPSGLSTTFIDQSVQTKAHKLLLAVSLGIKGELALTPAQWVTLFAQLRLYCRVLERIVGSSDRDAYKFCGPQHFPGTNIFVSFQASMVREMEDIHDVLNDSSDAAMNDFCVFMMNRMVINSLKTRCNPEWIVVRDGDADQYDEKVMTHLGFPARMFSFKSPVTLTPDCLSMFERDSGLYQHTLVLVKLRLVQQIIKDLKIQFGTQQLDASVTNGVKFYSDYENCMGPGGMTPQLRETLGLLRKVQWTPQDALVAFMMTIRLKLDPCEELPTSVFEYFDASTTSLSMLGRGREAKTKDQEKNFKRKVATRLFDELCDNLCKAMFIPVLAFIDDTNTGVSKPEQLAEELHKNLMTLQPYSVYMNFFSIPNELRKTSLQALGHGSAYVSFLNKTISVTDPVRGSQYANGTARAATSGNRPRMATDALKSFFDLSSRTFVPNMFMSDFAWIVKQKITNLFSAPVDDTVWKTDALVTPCPGAGAAPVGSSTLPPVYPSEEYKMPAPGDETKTYNDYGQDKYWAERHKIVMSTQWTTLNGLPSPTTIADGLIYKNAWKAFTNWLVSQKEEGNLILSSAVLNDVFLTKTMSNVIETLKGSSTTSVPDKEQLIAELRQALSIE